MVYYLTIFSLLLLCVNNLHSAEDDEVRFKTKTYSPRNAGASSRAYVAKNYQPKAASGGIGVAVEKSNDVHSWKAVAGRPFKSDKDQPLSEEKLESEPYKVQQQIKVPTITADKRMLQEHETFETAGKDLATHSYAPAEKPREKNPLLTPRQSIKETE